MPDLSGRAKTRLDKPPVAPDNRGVSHCFHAVEESIMAGPVCVAGCRRGLAVRGGLLLAVGLWACLGPCDRAWSQTGRLPSNGKYGAFGEFYDGD